MNRDGTNMSTAVFYNDHTDRRPKPVIACGAMYLFLEGEEYREPLN